MDRLCQPRLKPLLQNVHELGWHVQLPSGEGFMVKRDKDWALWSQWQDPNDKFKLVLRFYFVCFFNQDNNQVNAEDLMSSRDISSVASRGILQHKCCASAVNVSTGWQNPTVRSCSELFLYTHAFLYRRQNVCIVWWQLIHQISSQLFYKGRSMAIKGTHMQKIPK